MISTSLCLHREFDLIKLNYQDIRLHRLNNRDKWLFRIKYF